MIISLSERPWTKKTVHFDSTQYMGIKSLYIHCNKAFLEGNTQLLISVIYLSVVFYYIFISTQERF